MKVPSLHILKMTRNKWIWVVLILLAFVAMRTWQDAWAWTDLGIVALCFACELMDSSLGMGYGTTLIPILLAMGYQPLELVPTILFSELLSGFSASYFHHHSGNVDFSVRTRESRIAMLLALGSVVGVVIGVNLAIEMPAHILKLIIGIIITTAGIIIWIFHQRTFAYRTWKFFGLAMVASFNKAMSGGGYGPLMTSGQILSGVGSRASVAITSFAEGFTCLVGVILFLGKGQQFQMNLMVPVLTGALLSVPFSTEIVKVTHERLLRRIIAVLTVVMGLFTILKVLF